MAIVVSVLYMLFKKTYTVLSAFTLIMIAIKAITKEINLFIQIHYESVRLMVEL